ncbi:MAG: glycosyltransferase [Balneolaceae bacterium]
MLHQPEITFIICTYNRAGYLDDTLKSLLSHQKEDANFEILVIDNNSSDNTREVVGQNRKLLQGNRLRYVKEPNQGLSYARNRGIKESDAPNIVFVDDDVWVTRDYISAWFSFFRDYPEAKAAGGKIHVQFDDPRPDWMSHFLLPLLGHHDHGKQVKIYNKRDYPFGGNMGFRKNLFETFGLFNTELGRIGTKLKASEEKEFFQRLKQQFIDIYYLPEAKLFHRVNKSRLTEEYIRRQASGLGQSMRLQLKQASIPKSFSTLFSEVAKVSGSVPIGLFYLLGLQFSKTKMLFRFRWWIWRGYFSERSTK